MTAAEQWDERQTNLFLEEENHRLQQLQLGGQGHAIAFFQAHALSVLFQMDQIILILIQFGILILYKPMITPGTAFRRRENLLE